MVVSSDNPPTCEHPYWGHLKGGPQLTLQLPFCFEVRALSNRAWWALRQRDHAMMEAYPVDSGLSRCSMLSDRIGAVARADTDGEGAVARGIPGVVSR